MKAAKWLKWKIGAICTVLLVLIFQLIKTSPQFQLQVDKESADKAAPDNFDLHSDNEDGVMREWQEQDMPSGDSLQESNFSGRRHFSRRNDGEDIQQPDNNGIDTRTSRS